MRFEGLSKLASGLTSVGWLAAMFGVVLIVIGLLGGLSPQGPLGEFLSTGSFLLAGGLNLVLIAGGVRVLIVIERNTFALAEAAGARLDSKVPEDLGAQQFEM